MTLKLCTGCGHSTSVDAIFCEDCGVIFSNETKPDVTKTQRVPSNPLPSTFITWIDVGGKSLALGAPMVAIFDFLSPRVALLQVAAIIAVVGLLSAVALRKFVAPNLPVANKFRATLAPDVQLHKSPFLIATGLLSALMVTGAAWSSSNALEGGVIASSFDAAKNAQMQLGVMQGLQKEQRVQTAVLEDIREGRTTNPRRELANQGILWKTDAFHDAVVKGDKPVVSLFLAGGMKWNLSTLEYSQRFDSSDIQLLLLEYPKSLEKNNQCKDAIYRIAEKEIAPLRKLSNRKAQSVPRLSELNTRLLKLFCSEPTTLAELVTVIKQDEETYKRWYEENLRKQAERLGPTPSITRTPEECIAELTASNGLRIQNALVSYKYSWAAQWERSGRGPSPRDDRGSFERLMDRAKAIGRFVPDPESKILLAAFCADNDNNISTIDDFDLQIFKQVYRFLS